MPNQKKPQMKFWKVSLTIQAVVLELDNVPTLKSWSVRFNVKARTKETAERMVQDEVPSDVLVVSCVAQQCHHKDFHSVLDFTEEKFFNPNQPK
jgi:hypothetical protein